MEKLFSITKKDLKVDYFSGTGAGGQYRNKHQNCVRIRHSQSGAVATGQSARDRKSNIREALNNLVEHPKFKTWINQKVYEITGGKTIEEIVDEQMAPENLKIEVKENERWIENGRLVKM
jgi:hypothetical protein